MWIAEMGKSGSAAVLAGSRSAMVRATLRMRSQARALMSKRVMVVSSTRMASSAGRAQRDMRRGVIWALQCTPGVSANRLLWISRARTTRARISADGSPGAMDCSCWNGTGSISTWRSMRSSSGPEIRLRQRCTCTCEHWHSLVGWLQQPHGQGFIDATSMNPAGQSTAYLARDMLM